MVRFITNKITTGTIVAGTDAKAGLYSGKNDSFGDC